MNISGVLVHVQPKRMDALSDELNAIEGVEVHAATDGKLVVTVESHPLLAIKTSV